MPPKPDKPAPDKPASSTPADPRYYRDPETGEDLYTQEALRDRALGVAKRIFAWEGHDIPRAYSGKLPVTDPLEESAEKLAPARVDQQRYLAEPPRIRVRLGMWRLVAECSVEHQLEGRALLAWRNRTEALTRGEPTVSPEHAKRTAIEVAGALPLNAVGPSVSLKGHDADDKTFQISWAHFVPAGPAQPSAPRDRPAPVLVDGDMLLVRVNAATGKPYTLFRKWRQVPDEVQPLAPETPATEPASVTAGAGAAVGAPGA